MAVMLGSSSWDTEGYSSTELSGMLQIGSLLDENELHINLIQL